MRLQQLYDLAKAETLDLGRRNAEIAKLQAEAERSRHRLRETRNRIEQLNLESSYAGKVEVLSSGRRPSRPINSGKRKQAVAIDALCGAAFGVGLILIIGLMIVRTPPLTADDDGTPFAANPQGTDAAEPTSDGSTGESDRDHDP